MREEKILPHFYRPPSQRPSQQDDFLARLEQAESRDSSPWPMRGPPLEADDKQMLHIASASDLLALDTVVFEGKAEVVFPKPRELERMMRMVKELSRAHPELNGDLDEPTFFRVMEKACKPPGDNLNARRRAVHTDAQRAGWAAVFRAADLDLSGSVSYEELASIAHFHAANQQKEKEKSESRDSSPALRASKVADDVTNFVRQTQQGEMMLADLRRPGQTLECAPSAKSWPWRWT